MSRTLRWVLLGVLLLASIGLAVPAHAGGGCHGVPFEDARSREVKAFGNCFTPTVARVDVGQTVTWHSGDAVNHTVTPVGDSFVTDPLSQALKNDSTVAVTFDEPGVYPYVCVLHPMMAGAIVVGDGVAGGTTAQAPAEIDAGPVAGNGTAVAAVQTGGINAAGAGLVAAALLVLFLVAGPRVLHTLRRD
jgi:plastocyanin